MEFTVQTFDPVVSYLCIYVWKLQQIITKLLWSEIRAAYCFSDELKMTKCNIGFSITGFTWNIVKNAD